MHPSQSRTVKASHHCTSFQRRPTSNSNNSPAHNAPEERQNGRTTGTTLMATHSTHLGYLCRPKRCLRQTVSNPFHQTTKQPKTPSNQNHKNRTTDSTTNTWTTALATGL